MLNFRVTSYVDALYSLSEENNLTDLYYENSKVLLELIIDNPKIINFLRDISITKKEKFNLIDKLFKDKIFKNFLYLVIEQNRISSLKYILDKFIKKVNMANGVEEGIVYTTIKLSSKELDKISEAMSKKQGKKIVLKNIIDNNIIGGIKVIISSNVWDYSISNRINILSKKIIKEKGV